MKALIDWVWFGSMLIVLACNGNAQESHNHSTVSENPSATTVNHAPPKPSTFEKLQDTTYLIPWKSGHIKVHCMPARQDSSIGTMLILPGWNHSTLFWRDKMSFCEKATRAGYDLVMPEMHKSNYTSKYFPETRKDMVDAPLMTWLTDTLMETMRNRFGFFEIGGANYVAGLSSGARGAVLVALAKPGVFKKGIAYSGDYDNSLLANDKVMANFYGPYHQFKNRWLEEANPAAHAAELNTAFFFIHGTADQVVLYKNSKLFFELLKQRIPYVGHQLKLVPGQGHTYTFWDSQAADALAFLQQR